MIFVDALGLVLLLAAVICACTAAIVLKLECITGMLEVVDDDSDGGRIGQPIFTDELGVCDSIYHKAAVHKQTYFCTNWSPVKK